MQKIIDLHIHTTISDGSFSPKEVIDEAAKNLVFAIAITDHDSIDAYTDEIIEYAKSKGVKLINAVEISTRARKVGVHVLGYNLDLNNYQFREQLSKLRNARHDYLYKVAKKLNVLGYELNVEKLDKIDAVTKAHISSDIIDNENNRSLLLKEFGHLPNKGEFIEKIMNENCPAYVKKVTVSPKEAAEMIRAANGKVVLAHPVAYAHEDNMTEEDVQKIIDDMKPDGLETNYIYVDRDSNVINEVDKWNKLAKKNNLFVTAGSDFHKKDGLHPEIGFVNVEFKLDEGVPEEILNNLLS